MKRSAPAITSDTEIAALNIIGPPGGGAVLEGTAGNDTIVARGRANTVHGNGGSDTVLALAGDNTITLGSTGDGQFAQTDSVTIGRDGNTISSGDASVLLTGRASGTTAHLGNGNNEVLLDGSGNTISAGYGDNTIDALGGHASVAIHYELPPQATKYVDNVAVSGAYNSVSDALYAGKYPFAGTANVQGGSGYGTFSLYGASGSVVTHGLYNTIDIVSSASMVVAAGSGYDTVNLSASPAFPQDMTIQLAGPGNTVTGSAGSATLTGGSGHATFTLGSVFSAGAKFSIATHGQHNVVSVEAGVSTVDPGSGSDTVTLYGGTANLGFHGTGDMLFLDVIQPGLPLQYGPVATVTGHHTDLSIFINPGLNTLTIADFAPTDTIHLLAGAGAYTTAAQAYAALTPDGTGGYLLPVDSGTIHFGDGAPSFGGEFCRWVSFRL